MRKFFSLIILLQLTIVFQTDVVAQTGHMSGESLITGTPINNKSAINYQSFPATEGIHDPLVTKKFSDEESFFDQLKAYLESKLATDASKDSKMWLDKYYQSEEWREYQNRHWLYYQSQQVPYYTKQKEFIDNVDTTKEIAPPTTENYYFEHLGSEKGFDWGEGEEAEQSFFGMNILGLSMYYEVGNVEFIFDKIASIINTLNTKSTISNFTAVQNAVNSDLIDLNKGYVLAENEVSPFFPIVFAYESGYFYSIGLKYITGGQATFNKGENPIDYISDYPACNDYIDDGSNRSFCVTQISDAITDALNSSNNNPDFSTSCIASSTTNSVFDECEIISYTSDSSLTLRYYTGYNLSLGYGNYITNITGLGAFNGELFYGLRGDAMFMDTYDVKTSFDDRSSDSGNQFDSAGEQALGNYSILFLAEDKEIQDSKLNHIYADFEFALKYNAHQFNFNLGVEHIASPVIRYKTKDVSVSPNPYLGILLFRLFNEKNKNFTLGFYQDLGKSTTLYGVENQWRVLSLHYSLPLSYTPDIHISKRYNLIRSRLEYTQFGISFGGVFDLNFSISTENVDIQKNITIPRSLMGNISFTLPI